MKNALRNGLVILTLAAVATLGTLGTSCKKEEPNTSRESKETYTITDNHEIKKEAESPYGLYEIISHSDNNTGKIKKKWDMRERGGESGEYIEIFEGEYSYSMQKERKENEDGKWDYFGEIIPWYSSGLGNLKTIENGSKWTVIGDKRVIALELRKKSKGIYEITEVTKNYRYLQNIWEAKKID